MEHMDQSNVSVNPWNKLHSHYPNFDKLNKSLSPNIVNGVVITTLAIIYLFDSLDIKNHYDSKELLLYLLPAGTTLTLKMISVTGAYFQKEIWKKTDEGQKVLMQSQTYWQGLIIPPFPNLPATNKESQNSRF